MTTSTPTSTGIPHAAGCKRPAPVLRLSWKQEREAWCPGCGRAASLDPLASGIIAAVSDDGNLADLANDPQRIIAAALGAADFTNPL